MDDINIGCYSLEACKLSPSIILIDPQLGDNIGSTARAMLNFGLTDLRLVRPRDGWPNPRAVTMAAGACEVLEKTKVYESTIDAVADLDLVFATTARERDLSKTVLTPNRAAEQLIKHSIIGGKSGILFGPERSGLINDDVVLADAVITVPLNPAFSSLNLAQAVLLIGYEWLLAELKQTESIVDWGQKNKATIAEREYFYQRLEGELDKAGFLHPDHLAPTIKRNLRSMFNKVGLTQQETKTLHGVVTALINPKRDK